MRDNLKEEIQALTQLVSYQLAINILPFGKKYSECIHYGLKQVVKTSKCRVCLFFSYEPIGDTISESCKDCGFYKASDNQLKCDCLLFNEKDIIVIPVQTIRKSFGYIALNNSLKIKPSIIASIRNFANVIAVNIENKQQKDIFEVQNNELKKLNIDKDRFISILGHDLKSPFNNILGLSEVLKEDIRKLDIDEIEDIAKNINKSAKITSNFLEDILMWARTQQGSIPFNPQNVSLSATCRNIIEILNPGAYAKNITIYDSSADHTTVYADADMLKTIILNLVSNAIKFTNSGGKITINAEQNSENVEISVSDNGTGISPENLSKLFDISQVLSTTGTAKETGTGLGLLLCKEFVVKHQGKIWVVSEEGKGSTFSFTLPDKV
jgi:two-component system sensor histidine kinase/response regulator